MADRRSHLRFQVMGSKTASLVTAERLQVVNIGTSGALVEGSLPLAANAEYQMQLVMPSHVSEATVKVRRVVAIDQGNALPRYQIGLEFLAVSSEAEEVISQFVSAPQAQP